MSNSQASLSRYQEQVEDVEGYTRIKHRYISMRDGTKLCADLFLPFSASKENKHVPVLCSLGPYGKDIHASNFGLPKTPIYAEMYKHIKPLGPDACFELCEPLVWTKEYGYALLRVDARGVGGSQGRLDPFGLERSVEIQGDAEGQDLYDIVEWAGTQPWSSGRVAFAGISYYGMVGYWAAMQKPPHLTCVLSYESQCNVYQAARRGGIYSPNLQKHWFNNIVVPSQSGYAEGILTKEELAANRVDYPKLLETFEYPTEGPWKLLDQCRKLSDISVPIYVAGNWTDPELHLAGNILANNGAQSDHKWLEMHTGNHLGAFFEPDHVKRQKQFLDYFLLDKTENGMLEVPRIRLLQHRGTSTFYREKEQAFPPLDAEDVAFFLRPDKTLSLEPSSGPATAIEYEGLKNNLTFVLDPPFIEPFELLGSPYLLLDILTEAQDMDIFIYLRAIDAAGNPLVLLGNHGEPMDSFARGFFRLSHRDEVAAGFKEGRVLSQPAISRSEVIPGKTYSVLIPLFPTAYLFDKDLTLQLEIEAVNSAFVIPPMRHEGADRTEARFSGKNVIFSNGKLVLPRVHRTL
ncbi:hypothetical protein AK830_g3364 [Neonectria ditissima]|uniref:Xaa-Pro dipeptidyl-peptidase C-terminal domain-containing protein n=1 Tax=Neonectria ditissima TaxID=78410 RepID=A0A0P7BQP0_9HYPO|nr:hypothetical protein AK830_g3364 [Neonectria ditissima]